jgi:hypothetical protein
MQYHEEVQLHQSASRRDIHPNHQSQGRLSDMETIRISLTAILAVTDLVFGVEAETQGPTIARLCIYVPQERLADVQAFYVLNLLPVLQGLRLRESEHGDRQTVPGVYSRFFVLDSPSHVSFVRDLLERDPLWSRKLADMASAMNMTESVRAVTYSFHIYDTPAGRGRTVLTGPVRVQPGGKGLSRWHTFDVSAGPGGNKGSFDSPG